MITSSSIVGWRFLPRISSPRSSFGKRERAERHALVELHAVADDGGLADDHAGAVIDEERAADAAPGWMSMPVSRVRELGHDARDQRHAELEQLVGDAVAWRSPRRPDRQKMISSRPVAAGSPSKAACTSSARMSATPGRRSKKRVVRSTRVRVWPPSRGDRLFDLGRQPQVDTE